VARFIRQLQAAAELIATADPGRTINAAVPSQDANTGQDRKTPAMIRIPVKIEKSSRVKIAIYGRPRAGGGQRLTA
jgi:hypothetical protein